MTTTDLTNDVYDVANSIVKQLQDNINANMAKVASELVTKSSGVDFSYLVKDAAPDPDVYFYPQDICMEDIDIVPPTNLPTIRVILESESIDEPSGSKRKALVTYPFMIRSYVFYPYPYDNDADPDDAEHIHFGGALLLVASLTARCVRNILIEDVQGKTGVYKIETIQTRYLTTGFLQNLNVFVKAVDVLCDLRVKATY